MIGFAEALELPQSPAARGRGLKRQRTIDIGADVASPAARGRGLKPLPASECGVTPLSPAARGRGLKLLCDF